MISVIMPVYNAELFIKQSIESVLNQTESDFELLVIDDGSTDNSGEIALSYKDKRIKYIFQENQGAASARNKGLDLAKGDFIVFQDSDDISMPNRFEILIRHFNSSQTGIVHSDMLAINEDNNPIGYWQSRAMEQKRTLRFFLKVGTFINGASMMLRKEVFNNLRYDTNLKIGEDTSLILEILKKWNSVHVPEPLYYYRKHLTNTTRETDYQVLALHVQKFIENHKIEELIPEVNWNENDASSNMAKAFAILALILFRRGMGPDGIKFYEKALNIGKGTENENFILGIGQIINNNYQNALKFLYLCEIRDHIVENYTGEVLALLEEDNLAYYHFNKALAMYPDYEESIENLKSLGAKKGYNLLDTTWMKLNSTNK